MTVPSTPLPYREEPGSTLDPVGRVFHHGPRVLRGIRAEYVDDVRRVLDLAGARGWFEAGLVPTHVTAESLDEFPLVLEHERAPFVTYRGEWPAEGLRAAALCYLEVARTLLASGWGLKDAHPWNVLFFGARPRVVDLGSVRPLAEVHWPGWWDEFRTYFLTPLVLFAQGDTALARRVMREHVMGVGTWLIGHRPAALLAQPDALATMTWAEPARALDALVDHIAALSFPHQHSEWTAYPQPTSGDATQLRLKDRIVAETLARVRPATLLDIGTNRGLHAFMATAHGANVLAGDIDEACVDDVHRHATGTGAALHAIHLDVVWPLGSGGTFGGMAAATERLRCDAVLCMALIHHVCVKQQFAPEAFIDGVAAFTRDALVLEFVPAEDVHVRLWPQAPPAGYTTDRVQSVLQQRFAHVERVMSEPDPRCLFLCEGRRA